MEVEKTILNDFMQVTGTYSTKKILEENGYTPLDKNKYYYAKIRNKTILEIWRTMGNCRPEENYGCVPIYGPEKWNPNDQYTKPFNDKIKELYLAEGIEFK